MFLDYFFNFQTLFKLLTVVKMQRSCKQFFFSIIEDCLPSVIKIS